jgi:hypothetical protein
MSIILRPSQPIEAAALSDVAIQSKGHRGHLREQLEIWRKDLLISTGYIEANTVETIWQEASKVGFIASEYLRPLFTTPEQASRH